MSGGNKSAPSRDTGGAQESLPSESIINSPNITDLAHRADQESLLTTGNTNAALQFLRAWAPEGPWQLTSMVPDGKITTQTFRADHAMEVGKWVDQRQGRQNMYFTVNPLLRPLGTKPKKTDMAGMIALHVDIDPRPGEDLEAERKRAEQALCDFRPKPTVIIDSGGGFQGFWMLEQLQRTDGSEERAAELEAYNIQLAVLLGADTCHNIDRIMRLPGTVNIPNEKKRKKGRTEAVARVVEAAWDRVYSISAFTPVPRVQSAGSGSGPQVKLSGNLPSVDLDLLPPSVTDRTKALIVNGEDPDDPTRWPSRSEATWHVMCELVRCGCDDDQIASVILDPDYAISGHTLDQPRPQQYAAQQIQKARAEQPKPGPTLTGGAMDWARAMREACRPHLRHHHEEFLDWDGAAYVSVEDATIRAEAWAFLNSCRISGKEGTMRPFNPTSGVVSMAIDAFKALLHLPPSREEPPRWLDGRARPDPLELLPTRSGLLHLPTGELMTATPELFTRNALDFLYDPAAPEPTRWLNFLREVWPDADEADCISALQEFMGYLLTPDTSLQKALLIPGPKRSGKGTIGRIMGKLVGEANTVAPSLNSFGRGDFGLEPLLAKQLAIVSDMRLSRRTDEAAVAENLLRITGEDRVSVNRKHRQALEVTLRTRFVVFTNEVPKFADKSGALVSRFIILPMQQSFYGREDPGLTAALMTELPGILNWAMEGWRRVRATGQITQPQAGGMWPCK